MKILAISDLHCHFDLFTPEIMEVKKECPDVILIAGDITNQGASYFQVDIHEAYSYLVELSKYAPIYVITGNHDIGMIHYDFKIPNVKNITDKKVEFQGKSIIGMNMTTCYNLPFLAKRWERTTYNKRAENAYYSQFDYADIVLSHSPAFKLLDKTRSNEHIGSKALKKYLKLFSPKLLICGHVHEEKDKMIKHLNTTIYNVAASFRYISI